MKNLQKISRGASIAIVAGAASSAMADLSYTSFNSTAGMALNGVAVQSAGLAGDPGDTLSLTPPAGNSAGSAWYTQQQPVAGGFTTQFQFRIRDKQGIGADGLAFVIQTDPRGTTALGGQGGAMGFGTNPYFPTSPGPGITSSVAIAFDTWDNTGDWPSLPGTNNIEVNTAPSPLLPNGPSTAYTIASGQANGQFNDASVHTVRIVYSPGILQVYYDSLVSPIVTAQLNLATQLNLNNGSAYVGFTAATGGVQNEQRQEILDWTMNSVIPAPSAGALIGLAGLCALRRRRSV